MSQQLNTVHFNNTVKGKKSSQNAFVIRGREAGGGTLIAIIKVHSPRKGNKRLLKFLANVVNIF